MSIGHGAFCKKLSENDECVIYAYSSFNYNDKRYLNDERICDGRIIISKKSFSDDLGILRDSLSELFENGNIVIENCSNTWMKPPMGYDVMAVHLLCKLLRQIQKLQYFPDKCNYEV